MLAAGGGAVLSLEQDYITGCEPQPSSREDEPCGPGTGVVQTLGLSLEEIT